MATYGFLGLGIMGREMAGNLLRAGHAVHVWNRTPAGCEALAAAGAVAEPTAAAVVAACPVTFAMVSDGEASRSLCFGEEGVLAAMGPGKGYIDCSTIDPGSSIEIGGAVAAAGGRHLEAPVSGSRKPAADGTLVFLCAGDESLYGEARPAFEVMGKRSFFFGETGRAARVKLVNNMVMGVMTVALAEGLSLAQASGLDPAAVLEVLSEGAVANPMFALKGPLMLEGRFDPAFPLKHMQKDLRLALQMGYDHARALPAASLANSTFMRACSLGLGDQDFCAVMKAVQGG